MSVKTKAKKFHFQILVPQFETLMKFFGKKMSRIHLVEGDFLAHRTKIFMAMILYVNNFRLWEVCGLNERLKNEIFCDLNDGVKIVVCTSLCEEKSKFRKIEGNFYLYKVSDS